MRSGNRRTLVETLTAPPPKPRRWSAQAETPRQRSRNPLLNAPIVVRLILGFLIAALIAALAASVSGVQQVQSLSQESQFHEELMGANSALSDDMIALQLLNAKVQNARDDAASGASDDTLASDQRAIDQLAMQYASGLATFAQHDLLDHQPGERALLTLNPGEDPATLQRGLFNATLATWRLYHAAQADVEGAVTMARGGMGQGGDPARLGAAYMDAVSAMRGLMRFESQLMMSVHNAAETQREHQQAITVVAAVIAFLCTLVVGWLISESLVRRLRQLRQVTQAVEAGQLDQRALVIGRDEIADVALSVNNMLDTIVGLLVESRRQRDAVTAAAERLFSDVRTVGEGDLRVNAAETNDPIGLLGSAFNVATTRFRRVVGRSREASARLDALAQSERERSAKLLATAERTARATPVSTVPRSWAEPGASSSALATPGPWSASPGPASQQNAGSPSVTGDEASLLAQLERLREHLRAMAQQGARSHARAALNLAEHAYLSVRRLQQVAGAGSGLDTQSEEFSQLSGVLKQLGVETYTIQQQLGAEIEDLDALAERLTVAARTQSTLRGSLPAERLGPPSYGPPSDAAQVDALAMSAQVRHLTQVMAGYAQENAKFARQISMIAYELRADGEAFQLAGGGEGG